MLILSSNWILDLLGRFHPMMVHFPIGLLIGAWLLELVAKLRKREADYSNMVYLGAITAFLAAIMGQLLYQTGSYSGEIIERHQVLGWLTAGFSFLTAYAYWKKQQLAPWIPFASLTLTIIGIGLAGHWGASVTHGEGYITGVFDQPNTDYSQFLHPGGQVAQDTFSKDQLDKLNLEVRAIFAHHCYQCHSTAKRKGGLALDHQEGVFAGGDNGVILIRGVAAESEIIRRLKLPRDHEDAMPQKGKVLPPGSIDLIELWINKGAHWADAGLKIFREAPIALEAPALPTDTDGFHHPVDQFVNQYFKELGISWGKPIEDHRFIRRAYLDITGLLPSPEAVQQFVDDPASNKRTLLIQSLLQDKENYTKHWLSFWNDLLRNDYSGPGFITNGRKQITDWLYQSILEDKPYNEMVAELINPTEASEGFIQGIQWRGVVNASQRTELQAAQNISQSLLGLNLKCASCHNSFINNLTLDQAYGFANIFATEPLEIYRCDKPTGRMANTAFLYPELGEVMADSLVDRLRQLATIITQPKNGRLYRTIVNRFWDKLFGRGLIAPVDDMDQLPWSQDLLDWLATDFIAHDYSIPHLLERIMTAQAYQLPAVDYESPNYLNSESFVFRGPAPRRLTAEQFADAISQTFYPLYHGVSYLPDDPAYPAKWIWFRDIELDRQSLPKPGDRYFRKPFQLNRREAIQSAEILITADHSFELFFNDKSLGSGNDWRHVKRFSVAPEALQKENIIAVAGTNDGTLPNPAALLFAMRIIYENDSLQYIFSDRTWMTTNQNQPEGWTTFDFEGNDWEKVYSQGSLGYWGKLPDFTFDEKETERSFARASLVKLDPFMKTLGRPTRENVATTREGPATLLQAMMLMNSEFLYENIMEGATQWVQNTSNDPELLIDQMYWNALGREASKKEQVTISKRLGDQPSLEAVADLIWSVVLLPEFQFL